MAAARALLLVALAAARTAAEPDPNDLVRVEQLQAVLAAVAEEVAPAVVAIRSQQPVSLPETDRPGTAPGHDMSNTPGLRRLMPAVGSGMIIDPSGVILTNEHVIHGAIPENITVSLFNGDTYTVQSLTSDPRSDLAVLRIDARDLKAVRLGDAATVRQGHFVIVLGNPFGSASAARGEAAMSFGVVSGLGRQLTPQLDPQDQRYYGNLIQTDARINPGNSGGPLINLRGEVIGINTAISTRSGSSQGVGYAIPIDEHTREIIARLARGEEIEYGYLGVSPDTPTAPDRQRAGCPPGIGAVVRGVTEGSPAAAADLRPGDIIVAFDGRPIGDMDALIRAVGTARAGREVEIGLYRDGQAMHLRVVPSRRQTIRGVNTDATWIWRGMHLANVTPRLRRQLELPESTAGVVVSQIEPLSPAEKAGVKRGMVLRSLNGLAVDTVRRLRELAESLDGPADLSFAGTPPVEIRMER